MTQLEHLISGINFGFEGDRFYIDYTSCGTQVGNYREEFKKRAKELLALGDKIMIGFSSGLDSQAVYHSFYEQNIEIKCAFLYQPGFNEIELEQLKILEKKYKFDPIIIRIDPYKIKDEVIDLYEKTGIPPNQQIHKKFLEQLPKDYNFIQGIDGPDLLIKNNKWYCLETANSFEISRLRAFQTIDRTGKIIGWGRTGNILLSLLTDDVVTAFMYSYNYTSKNKLLYSNGAAIPIIDYWDLYIKPYIYGKYWKEELEYFPKYQGCEGIEYVMSGPKHEYRKNAVYTPYNDLVLHLSQTPGITKRNYQNQ